MLRIVSYNIHSGKDLFWRNRLAEMARLLASLNADVIALQEVHQNPRFGYQAEYLAEQLSLDYAFGPALQIAGGSYGNALLTRLPLLQAATLQLPALREPRSLLKTTLLWQDTELSFWVVHSSLRRKCRHLQAGIIRREIHREASQHPLIISGDFNTQTPSIPSALQDCAREKALHTLPTLPTIRRRYDFVFASSAWRVCDYEVLRVHLSDHYPILVTLQLHAAPVPEG
jgi:endonuclease/exonuclease/phosphatase family metal-dependent hydrolase